MSEKKFNTVDEVILHCQNEFYEGFKTLPEGTVEVAEEMIIAAANIYGSIVYEGLKSYREFMLADENITEETLIANLDAMSEFTMKAVAHRVNSLLEEAAEKAKEAS